MSNKYSQTLLDIAKKSSADAIKSSSKRAIQKTADATGNFIGNKTAGKITSISKSPQNTLKELHSKTDENEIKIPKERYILQKKEQQIIDELRLIWYDNEYQRIINLLDNTPDQLSKFKTKNWIEKNDQSRGL